MIQVTGLHMAAAMIEDAAPQTASRRDSARAEALAAVEAVAVVLAALQLPHGGMVGEIFIQKDR